MINFKNEIVDSLDKVLNKDDQVMTREDIENNLETPPDYKMGDYAFPVFPLAKVFRKAPALIAEDLAGEIENKNFQEIKSQGPYLNFYIDRESLAKTVLDEVYERREDFARGGVGEGKNVCLDYSSPNIAKPFHIGHLRSTVIGDSIERIYKFLGYTTYGYNHLGDYGTQFGMLIVAMERWNVSKEQVEKDPIPQLLDLYVKINKLADEDEEVMKECRHAFSELEKGNEKYVKVWEWIREISLQEFKKVYKMLDIDFYKYQGEAFYSDLIPEQVEKLKSSDILVEKNGATAVNLEDKYGLPNPVVLKSDGSSMYMTRDIATAYFRHQTHHPYRSLYVVASEQRLYFEQLKLVLKEMGYDWYDEIHHVQFGLVSLPDGSLSTRKGRVLYLEDVLNKAVEKVRVILDEREKEKGYKMENKDELAKAVGIGAVKFQELFNQRIKDYVFEWDKTLSFEGETGPYVQYTHARISSLLDRGDFDIENSYNTDLLTSEDETNLLRSLYEFKDVVIDAHNRFEPYLVTRFVTKLAKLFNTYYNSTQILVDDEELRNARLMLSYAVKVVIKTGLGLLGIKALDRM